MRAKMINFTTWLYENASDSPESNKYISSAIEKSKYYNGPEKAGTLLPRICVAIFVDINFFSGLDLLSLYFWCKKNASINDLDWLAKLAVSWGIKDVVGGIAKKDIYKVSLNPNKKLGAKRGDEIYIIPNPLPQYTQYGIGTPENGLFARIFNKKEMDESVEIRFRDDDPQKLLKNLSLKSPTEVFSLSNNYTRFIPLVEKLLFDEKWLKPYKKLLSAKDYCDTVTEGMMSLDGYTPRKISNVFIEAYIYAIEELSDRLEDDQKTESLKIVLDNLRTQAQYHLSKPDDEDNDDYDPVED